MLSLHRPPQVGIRACLGWKMQVWQTSQLELVAATIVGALGKAQEHGVLGLGGEAGPA